MPHVVVGDTDGERGVLHGVRPGDARAATGTSAHSTRIWTSPSFGAEDALPEPAEPAEPPEPTEPADPAEPAEPTEPEPEPEPATLPDPADLASSTARALLEHAATGAITATVTATPATATHAARPPRRNLTTLGPRRR
jgi:hypothetical protein